jgi:uncharacterized protein YjbI with pentapeptide repeats
MEQSKIKMVQDLLTAYKGGQRSFSDLEFENEESFHGKDFTGSTFENCCFMADFTSANLTNCIFRDCNLKTTDFRNANLAGATIKNCSVESTMYKGAKTEGFIFDSNYYYGATIGQDAFIKHLADSDVHRQQ